jgi:hypothetical protein
LLESSGNNETISAVYGVGSGTEIYIDNSLFDIRRDGSDSNIYVSYNEVKNGKINFSRAHFKIDADQSNNFQPEFVSENAGIASEFKSHTVSYKSSANPSHTNNKNGFENKIHPANSKAPSNTTRIVKSDTILLPADNFILITAEQKTQITLPTFSGPKLKDLNGTVESIIYQFKVAKEYISHVINAGGNNRINEFDKQIIIDNSKIWTFRSVGDEWICY